MEKFVKAFWTQEDGNTTIDWLVFTAGLVLLGAALMASIGPDTHTMADDRTFTAETVDVSSGV